MRKSVTTARSKAVMFFIAATLFAGSLAVALPLNSLENDDPTPKLKIYSDVSGITELPKKNGAYVVIPGEQVYLQLVGLSDNKIMTEGSANDGETKALISYSSSGKNYNISFLQIVVKNGNSEIFPWTVGDFNADGVYDPNNANDKEIFCGTTGVVMYGKINPTSVLSILKASESEPDFVGYCGPQDLVGNDTGSSNGESGANADITSITNNFCISRTINGNVKITDETNVGFVSCKITGNVTVENSRVTFRNSNLENDLDAENSDLIIKGTEIKGNVSVTGGSLMTEHATILGDLTCSGTDFTLISTAITGIVSGCDIIGSLSTDNLSTNANFAPVLIGQIGDQSLYEEALLTFTVVTSDANAGNTLTYSLSGAPSGASINSSTGVFTWTPTEAQGPGSYTFDVVVTDDGNPLLSTRETITVTVLENTAPVLNTIGNKIVNEETLLTFTATTSDAESPPQTLTYSLSGAPSGASINSSTGVFTWTPTEAQGQGSHVFSVIVSDSILTDSETITVTVNEANAPPVLNAIGNKTVNEETLLTFTATATDPDPGSQTLTYSLSGAPSGASINSSTGVFTWTPTEAQGAGSYTFTVVVTDNGTPSLSDSETITVTVNEANAPPVLNAIGNKSVDELTLLTFTATATDPDPGSQTLTYSLSGAPSGTSINSSTGVFTWTPTEAQGAGSYTFNVVVTDNGSPALSDSETITVTVYEVTTIQVSEGWDSKNGQTLSSLGKLNDVQANDGTRYTIDQTKWGSFQFDSISFPGGATIVSVKIYVNHQEEAGFGAANLVWKAGQGTIQVPTTLTSITAPVNPTTTDVTDEFDVSSVINTSSLVNGLIFMIEDNDSAKKTRIDHVYVEVKYST